MFIQQFNLLQINMELGDDFILQLYKESIDYQIYLQICLYKLEVKDKLNNGKRPQSKSGNSSTK